MQVGGFHGGVVEEVGDELIGPDHEPAGSVAGGAPPFDAFGFPDDRFRPGVRGTHESGRVGDARDDPVPKGVVERIAQGGPDPVPGWLTGGLHPGNTLAYGRVRIVAQSGDLVVAFLDLADQGLDVVRA
jgi:hypothetical protein